MSFQINKNKYYILDGAMGTMLQKKGLPLGERPEFLSLSDPDIVTEIHRAYLDAGADVIYTNTFGANELKLEGTGKQLEDIIEAAVFAARRAAHNKQAAVALDVGPLGELLEPAGTLTFEKAYACYARMMRQGEKSGADLIVLETMTDLYEVKAAVLAAKEQTNLPIWVSMTFEENSRTFTGCSIEAMALLMEGLGVQAVGINCSLGPDEIYPLAQRLCSAVSLPVFVKPNAGLPDPATGSYRITPKEFAESLARYQKLGICMVGGCCGTTPDYIKAVSRAFADAVPVKSNRQKKSAVSTAARVTEISDVTVVGECINPTGKKPMQQALRSGDIGYILRQAVLQTDAGAQILDVNVGMPGVEEQKLLPMAIKQIQSVTDVPLQLDSSDVKALEQGLRVYNGKPIVNSVNGNQVVLDAVLPLVKKYGAAVIGLTLDEAGIPKTAQERFYIAERILKETKKYGIAKEDVYIDCLTLTASAQQSAAAETLRAVQMVKSRLGVKTVLGISNISFGLPNRELLNQSFLLMALQSGLDLPIINPNSDVMMDVVAAFRVLNNLDGQAVDYIERYQNIEEKQISAEVSSPLLPEKSERQFSSLTKMVKEGLCDETVALTKLLLKSTDAMLVVNRYLIPALDEVGVLFEEGKLFLPQLLQAANAAQAAFGEVEKKLAAVGNTKEKKGPIVIAAVQGDIHDIGKNIVKVILENYGYQVIDLGRDVPPQRILEVVQETKAPLVGLSALMTTTLKSMKETILLLRREKADCKIMAGGAVLTPEYALEIGADYYAGDARQAVEIARKVIVP